MEQKPFTGRPAITAGMEIYVPPHLDEKLKIPKKFRMREGGIIRVSEADENSAVVELTALIPCEKQVSDENLRRILGNPYSGIKTVDGHKVIIIREITATATRDILEEILMRVASEKNASDPTSNEAGANTSGAGEDPM